jgi:hypothetical protein
VRARLGTGYGAAGARSCIDLVDSAPERVPLRVGSPNGETGGEGHSTRPGRSPDRF